MSLLTITYTPQLTSDPLNSSPFICHRICYRIEGVVPYCCEEDTTASTAGVPKTFNITISAAPCGTVPDVDPESCANTVYEGYVQACCEDESSLSGRVDFRASFIADPSCINKFVCCQSQRGLQDSYFNITDPGAGYDNALTPLTVFVVRNVSDPVAAGGPNDASVQATIAGGIITALTTISAGLYGITPTLVIPSPTLGPPTTTATAIAVIPCADLRYQGDCDTSPQTVQNATLLLGNCASMCFPKEFPFIYSANDLSGLPDVSNFRYADGGCCDCTTCRNYTIITGSNQGTIDICYTQCANSGNPAEEICVTGFYPGSGTFNLNCVVPGSIFCTNDPNAILSITDNGACGGCP